MKGRRRFIGAIAAGCVLGTGVPRMLRAQAAPSLRQASLIVGAPPGGATDLLARVIGEGIRGRYAETILVDNRPGAGGRLAAEYVKNSRKDGTTVFVTPLFPMAIYPHIYRKLGYDPRKDFAPVGVAARSMMSMSVGPSIMNEVKDVAEFVAWCKANPGKATYGASIGSSQHFFGYLFSKASGAPLTMAVYQGGAPATRDLLGGHIHASINPIAEILPLARSGKLRVLAVGGIERSQFLPEVPTMRELGYPGIIFQDWLGIFVSAGTPVELISLLNSAAADAVSSEQGRAALAKLGMFAAPEKPEVFARTFQADFERYRKIVEEVGFKAEE